MDIIKGQITRDQIALLSIALTFRLATNVPHMRNFFFFFCILMNFFVLKCFTFFLDSDL